MKVEKWRLFLRKQPLCKCKISYEEKSDNCYDMTVCHETIVEGMYECRECETEDDPQNISQRKYSIREPPPPADHTDGACKDMYGCCEECPSYPERYDIPERTIPCFHEIEDILSEDESKWYEEREEEEIRPRKSKFASSESYSREVLHSLFETREEYIASHTGEEGDIRHISSDIFLESVR